MLHLVGQLLSELLPMGLGEWTSEGMMLPFRGMDVV